MFFRTPSTIQVAGPSGSGKTVFVSKLLQKPHRYFRNLPDNIHYCYGIYQKGFDDLKKKGVHFHQGLPTLQDLKRWFEPTHGGLLVLDDLMDEAGRDKSILDLFTKDSNHRNITVIYLLQDLFPRGTYAKTISRNAHYIVAFKSPRYQSAIRSIMTQMFPTYWRDALEAYNDATSEEYGYLMIDLHPASNDKYRLFANILDDQGYTRTWRRTDESKRTRKKPLTRSRRV